ncbi:MAG: hypothetical protein WCO99_13295 [Planctomycetota bacterium]
MSDRRTATVIERQVATALVRHRDSAGFLRLVAAELPPRERPPWIRMADALDRGDASAGMAAATRSIGCWIPLFASQTRDPRLAVRLLQTAARPTIPSGPWTLLWYLAAVTTLALGLLVVLSLTVIPAFQGIISDFGVDPPIITEWVLRLPAMLASVWQPLIAAAGVIALPWWLATRGAARSAATATAFTRTLARLIAADVPADEALALASHAAGVRPVNPAAPRRPLGYAAAAATEFDSRTAAVLLDAIADCHDDRSRGRLGLGQWLIGPVLISVVGLIVGLVTLAVFLPLIRLVSDLS